MLPEWLEHLVAPESGSDVIRAPTGVANRVGHGRRAGNRRRLANTLGAVWTGFGRDFDQDDIDVRDHGARGSA